MSSQPSVSDLRRLALTHSLFPPTTLPDAIDRLGFVQADPIRAPARAQDLILRHRVTDYRAGDLDREYEPLGLEEDHLFVYGFLPHATWRLLHPRSFDEELSDLERGIIAAFEAEGSLDSRALEERFGAGRGMNPWGSYSRATQLALDHLH
ncbi:MAG: crosslink repair DNA glycosylase YcaQ family protein, partial [Dehalococcoidia bacterium]